MATTDARERVPPADATGRVPPVWPFYGRAALLRGRNGEGGRDGARPSRRGEGAGRLGTEGTWGAGAQERVPPSWFRRVDLSSARSYDIICCEETKIDK